MRPVNVSLRKMEIYDRRNSGKSSMLEAYRMLQIVDPDLRKMAEKYRKIYKGIK